MDLSVEWLHHPGAALHKRGWLRYFMWLHHPGAALHNQGWLCHFMWLHHPGAALHNQGWLCHLLKGELTPCHSEHREESIPAVMDSSLRSEWQGSTSGDACATNLFIFLPLLYGKLIWSVSKTILMLSLYLGRDILSWIPLIILLYDKNFTVVKCKYSFKFLL